MFLSIVFGNSQRNFTICPPSEYDKDQLQLCETRSDKSRKVKSVDGSKPVCTGLYRSVPVLPVYTGTPVDRFHL